MSKYKKYIFLYLLFLFYSIGTVCSKYASKEAFLSWKFIILYGAVIGILGVYAILWQQILHWFPLNIAYANKAVLVLFGMVWGTVLFGEKIVPGQVLGAAVIIVGIYLVVKNDG